MVAITLVSWGDGDPTPWLWIALGAAPLGVVLGAVAWIGTRNGDRRLAVAATLVSSTLTLLWLLGAISFLVSFDS